MYIYQKLTNHIIAYFALKFLGRKYSKLKQKKNYISCLWEGLESHLASTTFIDSGTINSCHLIRKRLESHLLSNYYQTLEIQPYFNQQQNFGSHLTASNLFINAFDIPNIISLPIEIFAIAHLLWHRYYYCLRIKDSILATCNLYKYI